MGEARPLSSPTVEGAIEALAAAGIRVVHVGILDMDSCLRERRLMLAPAVAALRGAYSFPNVLVKWDVAESVYDTRETFCDEPAAIDPTTGRHYPFEKEAALFVADFTGPSAAVSPRSLLRRQVERAGVLGFRALAAIE